MRSVICCILLVGLIGCGNNVVKVDTSSTTPPAGEDPVVNDTGDEPKEALPRWVLTDKRGKELRIAASPSEYYAFDPTFQDPVRPLLYTEGCFTALALNIGTLQFVNVFSLQTGRSEECLTDEGDHVSGFHLDAECTSPVIPEQVGRFTPAPHYARLSNGQVFSAQAGELLETDKLYQFTTQDDQAGCSEWPIVGGGPAKYRPLEPVPEELLSVFEDGAPYTLEWR